MHVHALYGLIIYILSYLAHHYRGSRKGREENKWIGGGQWQRYVVVVAVAVAVASSKGLHSREGRGGLLLASP